jgi:hypothetical protein
MCPDRQILSLYLDGELPSPWKEKLETHLSSCPACVSRLEEYRRLSALLAGSAGASPEAARERVWQRLAPRAGLRGPHVRRGGIWSRRVSLPFPAAAAAAAVLVAALAVAFRSRPSPAPAQDAIASSLGLEVNGISPAADLNGVLQYLGDTDGGDILIIRLPESKSFTSSGEPALLRAADYSRNPQR